LTTAPEFRWRRRENVFEPFFKGDDARGPDNGGFGLGLSIARDIIKRQGGGIEMHSADPARLRVLMILPPEDSLHKTQQSGSASAVETVRAEAISGTRRKGCS
jgi:signal transduction histidine kinase